MDKAEVIKQLSEQFNMISSPFEAHDVLARYDKATGTLIAKQNSLSVPEKIKSMKDAIKYFQESAITATRNYANSCNQQDLDEVIYCDLAVKGIKNLLSNLQMTR